MSIYDTSWFGQAALLKVLGCITLVCQPVFWRLCYVSPGTSIRDAYPTRTKTLERAVPCMEIPGLHAVRQRADRSQAETDYGHNTRTYVGCAGILGFPGLGHSAAEATLRPGTRRNVDQAVFSLLAVRGKFKLLSRQLALMTDLLSAS
jgi:hypothetical protein